MKTLLSLFLALCAAPLAAQDITREVLERPGTAWVAADLPIGVRTGGVMTAMPFAQFQDGVLVNGFVSPGNFFFEADCPNSAQCMPMGRHVITSVGRYDIDRNVIALEEVRAFDWILGPPQLPSSQDLVRASGFIPFETTRLFRSDASDLIVEQLRPEGRVIYIALPDDHMTLAQDLPRFTGQLLDEVYSCTIRTLAAILATPEPERSREDRQILALAQVAASIRLRRLELDRLQSPRATFNRDQAPPSLQTKLTQLEVERRVLTGSLSAITVALSEDSDGGGSLTRTEARQVADRAIRVARDAPDSETALALSTENTALLLDAAGTLSRMLVDGRITTEKYKDVICGTDHGLPVRQTVPE